MSIYWLQIRTILGTDLEYTYMRDCISVIYCFIASLLPFIFLLLSLVCAVWYNIRSIAFGRNSIGETDKICSRWGTKLTGLALRYTGKRMPLVTSGPNSPFTNPIVAPLVRMNRCFYICKLRISLVKNYSSTIFLRERLMKTSSKVIV